MSSRITYAYQEAARKAATVCHVDEGRQTAFVAGVEWTVDRFRRMLSESPYENTAGYPKKMMDGMTLDGFREIFAEFANTKAGRWHSELATPERLDIPSLEGRALGKPIPDEVEARVKLDPEAGAE